MQRKIPPEIEALGRTQGLSAEGVYELYLSEYTKLERAAKVKAFVPIFAWRQAHERIRELRRQT